jgi:GT2 family glycosyltransferase
MSADPRTSGEGRWRGRLSALIVNYDSGEFALACAQSLRAQWRGEGRELDSLEIAVVDNASTREQGPWLERLEALGAKVVRAQRNLGYAQGMNLALANTSGAPADAVAVLNPDLVFLPGSLGRLLDAVQAPGVGAVAPRAFVDPACAVQLPRNVLPTPREHWSSTLAQMSPARGRAYANERARLAVEWWTSDAPLDAAMLSGACLFLRRETLARLGELFDGRYPLYYEDTDLFRRLTGAGYRLVQEPRACVLHHWARSTGVGAEFASEPLRRYALSQRAYFRRWHGRTGAASVAIANLAFTLWPRSRSFRPIHELAALGPCDAPVAISLPRRARFVLELALAPTFLLAAGIVGEGEGWSCPRQTWDWFFQGPYYLRALEIGTGELLGAWSFEKTTPPAARPLLESDQAVEAVAR